MSQESDREPFVLLSLRVVARKDLPANAKLLHALIAGLAHKQGYCWASNAFLGARLGVESRYVSSLPALLEAKGLLRSVVDQKQGNARRLYVLPESAGQVARSGIEDTLPHAQLTPIPHASLDDTSRTNEREGDGHMCATPHEQIAHQVLNLEGIKESKKESGEESFFDFSGRKCRDEKHGPDRLAACAGRARQTEALRGSEKRYRQLWQALSEPQRRIFRAQAQVRPGTETMTEAEVETRACYLFAASEAKAWIQRRKRGASEDSTPAPASDHNGSTLEPDESEPRE